MCWLLTNKDLWFNMFLLIETQRTVMQNLKELSELISSLNSKAEIAKFLNEILTESEVSTLSKRWRILKMLSKGITQREIAKTLNVGLCKVTRGAKIIQNKKAITTKYLIKEKNNENSK